MHVPPQWQDEPHDVSATHDSAVRVPCSAQGSPPPVMAWRKETAKGKWAPVHAINSSARSFSDPETIWAPRFQNENWQTSKFHDNFSRRRYFLTQSTANSFSTLHHINKKMDTSKKSFSKRDFLPREMENSADTRSLSAIMGTDAENSLFFSAIKKTHEGRYLCQATNGVGAGLSKIISVLVQEPPRLSSESPTVEVRVGAAATLKCKAFGDPPLSLRWSRDQRELASLSRFIVEHTTDVKDGGSAARLTIEKVGLQDSGSYRCEASNPHGSRTAVFKLLVEDVPGEVQALRVEESGSRHLMLRWRPPTETAGNITSYIVRHSLQQEVSSTTPTEVHVQGTTTHTTLEGLLPASWYTVAVAAANRVGRGNFSGAVTHRTEEEKPSGAPRDVQVTAASSTSLAVRWESPSPESRHGRLLGFYLGIARVRDSSQDDALSYNFTTVGSGGDTSHHSAVSGLVPYTSYSVVVRAFNAQGAGPPSEPVTTRTLQDRPSSPPSGVRCAGVSPTALEISWQPLPQDDANGIVVGYRVTYVPAVQSESSHIKDGSSRVSLGASRTNISGVVETQNVTASIDGLASWSAYSVQVSAATQAGYGSPSPPILCTTKEGIPDAPHRIRAVAYDRNSVVVSWTTPRHPRGRIVSYVVNWQVDGVPHDTGSHRTGDGETRYYKIRELPTHTLVKLWVQAESAAGLSPDSPIASLTLTEEVGAGIWSVGGSVSAAWRTDVLLECRTAGQPQPNVSWTHDHQLLHSKGGHGQARVRWQVTENNALRLLNVDRSSGGQYRCTAANQFNTDNIHYNLTVLVPPSPPSLHVTKTTSSSVRLQWHVTDDGGSPVTAATLYYRTELGDTKETSVKDSHATLAGLECGSRYKLFMICHNSVGSSDSSPVIDVTTKGSPPEAPPQFQFITQNGTQVTLYLGLWQSGGCPITHFTVERKLGDDHWRMVNAEVAPTRTLTVGGLEPLHTVRLLRVTAHNSAGATAAVYSLQADLALGVDSPWSRATAGQGPHTAAVWQDMRVVAPALSCLLLLLGAAVKLLLCIRNRRSRLATAKPSSNGLNSYISSDVIQNDVKTDDDNFKKKVANTSRHHVRGVESRSSAEAEYHAYADVLYKHSASSTYDPEAEHRFQHQEHPEAALKAGCGDQQFYSVVYRQPLRRAYPDQAASAVPNDGSVVIQTYRREKPGRKNSTMVAEVQDVKKSRFLETSTSFEDREIYDRDSRMK
ncbi:Down syndrome cell adhesion molecule-like protein Dscam2 [Hyalella azteca]|uniref:Down syndrome cell adhesion molecule-like protein Dscam2 n=1 Tax=Hyalella azteca TaxID=294128 RepID=A0A979FTX3_HYAAZ|nr:Down syndrome cell adhesion molecule-like protein Dscam2 [Hyalella azteca]